jgi:membrane protease YdiL (CAAX protease family)
MKKNSQKGILIDAGMILFLILFPHFIPIPFYSYAIICFIVLLIFLKRREKNLGDIGFQRRKINLKTILIGISSAMIWVAFMRWVFVPIISNLFTVPDYTEYDFIKNNISNLIITTIAAWIVGGFYEEIVFRGFINSTIEKYLNSFWISASITSILFGLYHWQQGVFGIVAAVLGGLYWSFIYSYFDKNLWNSILSHAIFDTITLTLIYLGLF